jgi:hypothetical protein
MKKRLEDDNEVSVFTFFVSCLFVGWVLWVGFLQCCVCKGYMQCIYHVSVNQSYSHMCKKYFINLHLYVSCVKQLELHLHNLVYFVGTV